MKDTMKRWLVASGLAPPYDGQVSRQTLALPVWSINCGICCSTRSWRVMSLVRCPQYTCCTPHSNRDSSCLFLPSPHVCTRQDYREKALLAHTGAAVLATELPLRL